MMKSPSLVSSVIQNDRRRRSLIAPDIICLIGSKAGTFKFVLPLVAFLQNIERVGLVLEFFSFLRICRRVILTSGKPEKNQVFSPRSFENRDGDADRSTKCDIINILISLIYALSGLVRVRLIHIIVQCYFGSVLEKLMCLISK